MLIAAIVAVSWRTYQLWHDGPWDLPKPGKAKEFLASDETKTAPRFQLATTKSIIDNNLFDPDRGASTALAETSSVAMQRLRNLVLVGTIILGASRYAILEDPSNAVASAPRGQVRQVAYLRLKLGDEVEGFKLSEINEKQVVFAKGASRVDVPLDFFRKAAGSTPQQATGTAQPRAGVAPRIPARPRGGEGSPPPTAQ